MQKNRQQKTYMAKNSDHQVKWFVFDAKGKTLGRLASEVANVLRGKHSPTFTPHADTGDGVIVTNASQIKVTGNKEGQKVYRRYTGYIGGLRETPYRVMLERKPEYIIEHAVKGMIPKTKIGRNQLKRLRVVVGDKVENFQAQKPIEANI